MTAQHLWDRFCEYYKFFPEVGLSLDISRVHFADSFISNMDEAMRRAFSAMEALEKGEIANPDEQRMVGHYWLRDASLAPQAAISQEISTTLKQIKDFARQVHSGECKPEKAARFSKVLVVGIGGSALGPQLVADALSASRDKMQLLFLDNTDPDGISRIISQLGSHLGETLCLIVSKSGGTPETRNGQVELAAEYAANGLSFSRHAVAITCVDSKLDRLAKDQQWLARFPMWDWVGGRTSLFSAVGLLPAALQGINIDALLEGAKTMDQLTRVPASRANPAALLALSWYAAGNGKGQKDMVVLPYKDRLCLFSRYLQQLVMESLGKELDLNGKVVNQGIAVYGNKGSTDQHAYVQQLREGVNNFFATFIEVLEDTSKFSEARKVVNVEPCVTSGDFLSGFCQGTRAALYQNKRDSITITIDRLTEQTLAALIALYERAVGFYATLVNVNAYHQPGVEAGKKAAARVLELQRLTIEYLANCKSSEGETAENIASALAVPDEVEAVFKILQHLAANPGRGIKHLGERHPKLARFIVG